MSTNRKGLLNKFSTVATCLCGEAWIHSNDLMTSSRNLVFKDVKELTPRCIQDGFRQMVILDHVGNSKVFYRNMLIVFSILFSRLEMMVTALTLDLQMGLGCATSSFPASMTALLTPGQLALLAPQGFLGGAIEARVLYRVAFAVSEKGRETNVNADSRMMAVIWHMLGLWLRLTDDERVPVSICPMHKVHGLGRALDRTVQLDLEKMSHRLGHNEVFLVLMQIAVFAVLSQLERVPPVRLLEPRKADTRNVIGFRGKKSLEGLTEPVCKHLYGCGGNMCTSMTF